MNTDYQQELHKGFDPTRRCNNVRWNCIDYALCNPDAHHLFEKYLRNFEELSVVSLFLKTCELLGIRTKQVEFSETTNYEDKNMIIFYWWDQEDKRWGFNYRDYHFIRRINGIWYGKDGQNSQPLPFPKEQLEFVIKQYDSDKKFCFIIE